MAEESFVENIGAITGEAIGQVGQDVADTLRQEVEQLREELTQRINRATKGATDLALAGALGAVAGVAAVSLPLIVMRRFMPSWLIALLIAGSAGGAAAYFAQRGLDEIAEVTPLDADRVKQSAKDKVL